RLPLSRRSPCIVRLGTQYVLQPKATDDDGGILHLSITAPSPWATFEATTGRLEGTPTEADIGVYDDIVIAATDGADDASIGPFSIEVTAVAGGAAELSWEAPTENEDGSPLTDLAGYKIGQRAAVLVLGRRLPAE